MYKARESELVEAFKLSAWQPHVEEITHSDMIATGGSAHASRTKISFTRKLGPFIRVNMYVPGSLLSEQYHLTDDEKAAVAQWINSLHLN
jgi:hypothetical protein